MGTAVADVNDKIPAASVKEKQIAFVVFVTVFLDLVGFGILIPIQPFFALSFGTTPAVVTLLSASYSLMQFLFNPLWGKFSDRVGRKPVMCLSIAFSAVGFFIFAFADSLWWLFFSRMLSGFGGANIGCAQAIMADITKPEMRAKAMGTIGAAIGLGFIVGPPLGGLLGNIGFFAPPLCAGALAVMNFVLAFFWLSETVRKKTTTHEKTFLRRYDHMWIFLALSFLMIMAFSLFEQSIALYINHQFSDDVTNYQQSIKRTSIFLMTIALISAVSQIWLLKRFADRWGERKILYRCAMVCVCALVVFPLVAATKIFSWLFFPGAFFAVAFSISLPSLASIISKTVSDDEQGQFLAKSQSYSALGRVIGPLICGSIFEISPHVPFLLAALLMLMCFILIIGYKQKELA